MNLDRVREWTGALRSGRFSQADGHLATRDGEDGYAFCCLGVGCKIAGVPAVVIDYAGEDGEDAAMRFGDTEEEELAPVEFLDWLGIEPESTRTSWDLMLDMPDEYLTYQGPKPGGGGLPITGERTKPYTLAELNDEHFTFNQIADLIDYFGLSGPE